MGYSKDQQMIVDHGAGSLLVSAAAGSGKTTTMVGHVLKRLETGNIDKMVILTFTRAAAGEMRQRIIDSLTKALEADPGNLHLRKQLFAVPLAAIGTIDSFCMNLVKEHFDKLDLSPDLRLADDRELGLIKDEILEQLLEEAFAEGSDAFLALCTGYSSEKDHQNLKKMILELYETAQNDADPEDWLDRCLAEFPDTPEDFLQSTAAAEMYASLRERVAEYAAEAEAVRQDLSADPTPKLQEILQEDRKLFDRILQAQDLDSLYTAILNSTFPTRGRMPEELGAYLDKYRGTNRGSKGYIGGIRKLTSDYRGLAEEFRLLKLTEQPVAELIRLTKLFGRRVEEYCRGKNITNFAGIEHYALQLLTEKDEEGNRVPTALAQELRTHYQEVIVDEYQDVNQLQELILNALTENALFMVGDVKQSIYRFRRAKPSIFVDKYERFEEDPASLRRRIDLKENYRSRPEILEGANDLFRAIMSPEAGGVTYDERAQLNPAASYEGEGRPPKLVLVESGSLAEDGAWEEARYIAGEIHRLFREEPQLYDVKKKEFRALTLQDIVILLHTRKRAKVFADVLQRSGIPAVYPHKNGFFDRREVKTVIALLKIIDNPRQDIPLAAALLSPAGGFTEDGLVFLRSGREPGTELWDCLQAQQDEPRIAAFLEKLETWRDLAEYLPLPELIRSVFRLSGCEARLNARPEEGDPGNIRILMEMAGAFESSGGRGLYAFLHQLETQKKLQLADQGEAERIVSGMNAVRIDSIHSSKGLEFPVVFLAQTEGRFNETDSKGTFFTEEEEGIALKTVDAENHIRTGNLLYDRIRNRVLREGRSEEIRLLYVAITRAQERFYMVGRLKGAEEKREELRLSRVPAGRIPASKVLALDNHMMMVLTAEANGLLPHFDVEIVPAGDLPHAADLRKEALPEAKADEAAAFAVADGGEPAEDFLYPHAIPQGLKAAYSVTELKAAQEAAQAAQTGQESGAAETEQPGQPAPQSAASVPEGLEDLQEENTRLNAADRGTAYHKLMEHLPWETGAQPEKIREYIGTAVSLGYLTPEEAAAIEPDRVAAFFAHPVGQRSLAAAREGKLRREQPFMMAVPCREIDPAAPADETVLVQGIIDLYFEEAGGPVLIDYKTDRRVTPEILRERHGAQMAWYARALHAATRREVAEVYVYSFDLRDFVRLDL
ncbi:MAG: UvrD-helicase domain-containing protein [Lachnospiraceae bacterium]|nr:UvrD-helicase domain-containing protein [Lachnospiraceae bacterium]